MHPTPTVHSPGWRRCAGILAGITLSLAPLLLYAADPAASRGLLTHGEYDQVIQDTNQLSEEDQRLEEWALVRVEALMARGRYAEARGALEKALPRFPNSLRLRLLGYDAAQQTGDLERAKAILSELDQLGGWREWAYRLPADRIALGQAALIDGGDPKRILERFFDPVKKEKPDFRDYYLASGELALDKSDYALAGKIFGEAAKKFPDDPDVQFGLARAFAPSDTEATQEAIEKTLKGNPNHVGAHLLLVEHHIDAEHLDKAETALTAALKINPANPESHALRAVLLELRNDPTGFKQERAEALKLWSTNPRVDHIIGRKLSQKYRFAEGVQHQRQALTFDPNFTPAKGQLAQDLLRLGETEEGWKLAEEVAKADPYDVFAFNLLELRDSIANFKTLESPHFQVRMDPKEAEVYGREVLDLLERAHDQLCKKYGLEPKQKTIVEIFPDEKDFAIRTFGLPGGAGYLGVCFGRVITANSPASRPGSPSNWQSVLWHEFAHVVTLQLTRNRMPRWLSEGISVYEERQARGNWGEKMKPRYRAMILGDDLTPVSGLSGSFLQPKSAAHLAFAYYESSLAVEFLLERFGLDAMKRIFAELARGVPLNDAIAKHAAPLEQIDREFADRARQLANGTAPKLDWSKPKPDDVATAQSFDQWLEQHPENYTALLERARKLITARKWQEAKAPLQKLIELYPEQHEADSPYAMLAKVHRELGETEQEVAMLQRVAELSGDATEAYARLMEIYAARKDWKTVLTQSALYEAVDPLGAAPYRFAAEAHEAQGETQPAIDSYRTLLQLDPSSATDVHFRLARLLHSTGNSEAKRHVLLALEEAPRFREALQLLVEINAGAKTPEEPSPEDERRRIRVINPKP
ncbi:tetratricopeptide repeat protein [Verrucomicrobiota bacterium sgz303538]